MQHRPPEAEPVRVFVTREIPEDSLRRLAEGLPGARIDVHRGTERLDPVQLLAAARGASALVCTLSDRIDAALLEALAPPLRVVATFAVGFENIDLDAARRLGVRVANTPGVLTDATAEIAIALLLACARRVAEGDRTVRAGRFAGWSPIAHRGHAIYRRTVGIVGAGRIGFRVAATLHRGFECEILVHSPRVPTQPDWQRELGARFTSLDALLASADFVSLHCPLSPGTRHLIDAKALARMQRHAALVNTARGALVDEAALVAELRSGRVHAVIDVTEPEIPAPDSPLYTLPNVFLTPHVAGAAGTERLRLGQLAIEEVERFVAGRPLLHAIEPAILERLA
jgi:lactate dehydrogenase-like 2-hydroxyacid dehydrogenase